MMEGGTQQESAIDPENSNSGEAKSSGCSTSPGKKARLLWLGELTVLFVLALFFRLAFNILIPHVNNFAACDAFEYINNGQALLQLFAQPMSFWQKCAECLLGSGTAADLQSVKLALEPLKDFYISGPVYPAVIALNVAAFGGVVANVHQIWPALLFGNSLLSALTCVFIALMAKESFGKAEARIAGVVSAIYPGFIVNSGRLYSETFACFLLVALSYLTLRGFRQGGNNLFLCFVSGFLAAALQLTRSVMSVLSMALIPLTFIQQKGIKRFVFLIPFVLGFALVAAPWLGFQKLAFGGGGLVVDRVGHYNFFIGNNIDTAGWLSYPYPDGRNVENESFPQLMKTAVQKSPARWFRLMLDKPLRLFKFPWNDFRTAVGIFDFRLQVAFHELLLLLSCIGLVLGTFLSAGTGPGRRELYCRLFLAGLFAFHCIYYLFITVPRYNLTSIPEMIVFAAAAIAMTARLIANQSTRKTGALLALSSVLLFSCLRLDLLPFFSYMAKIQTAWALQAVVRISLLLFLFGAVFASCRVLHGHRKFAIASTASFLAIFIVMLALPLRANGRFQEWPIDINKPIKQTLRLPLSAASRQFYLLLDTAKVRQPADGLHVTVNGKDLEGPVLPSMAFAEDFDRFLELRKDSVQREGERMWDSLANSAGCGSLDLRQWSMIALPQSLIMEASDKAQTEKSPFVNLDVSVENKSANPDLRLFGSYDTDATERLLPSVASYSWEKVFYGVENSEGLTDTRYDIKVPSATLLPSKEDLSDQLGLQNGVFNMALLSAPSVVGKSEVLAHRSYAPPHSEVGYGAHGSLQPSREYAGVPVNTELGINYPIDLSGLADGAAMSANTIWIFHLKGRTNVLSGTACPAAEIETTYQRKDGTKFSYKSAWVPKRLGSNRVSGKYARAEGLPMFEFAVPVKPLVQDSKIVAANLNLRITSPISPYLNRQFPPQGLIEFSNISLDLLALPTNPIGLGHTVY